MNTWSRTSGLLLSSSPIQHLRQLSANIEHQGPPHTTNYPNQLRCTDLLQASMNPVKDTTMKRAFDSPSRESNMNPVPCKRRRRDGRWGPRQEQKPSHFDLPTAITSTMTAEQIEAYAIIFCINEITEQLRVDHVPPAQRPRSLSPDPEYDHTGRRTNTRQQRHRRRLEQERAQLVETALNKIPGYSSPFDHSRHTTSTNHKISEKVYLPVTDFPGVNFIGQSLGPRGSSLKAMNEESGANIVIRDRGSIKEGRGRVRQDGGTGPLHCLITADSQQKIDCAKKAR